MATEMLGRRWSATMLSSSPESGMQSAHASDRTEAPTRHFTGRGGTMPQRTWEKHVENLESRVTAIEQLPGRIDELTPQILR